MKDKTTDDNKKKKPLNLFLPYILLTMITIVVLIMINKNKNDNKNDTIKVEDQFLQNLEFIDKNKIKDNLYLGATMHDFLILYQDYLKIVENYHLKDLKQVDFKYDQESELYFHQTQSYNFVYNKTSLGIYNNNLLELTITINNNIYETDYLKGDNHFYYKIEGMQLYFETGNQEYLLAKDAKYIMIECNKDIADLSLNQEYYDKDKLNLIKFSGTMKSLINDAIIYEIDFYNFLELKDITYNKDSFIITTPTGTIPMIKFADNGIDYLYFVQDIENIYYNNSIVELTFFVIQSDAPLPF